MNKVNSTHSILVIEDSPEDYQSTYRAFRKCGITNAIFHCEDGDEALRYLYRMDEYKSPDKSPRPGIILLDLNMPGTDGRAVLNKIKSDADLKDIPVVILTTSSDQRDIRDCYAQGANSYIEKPVNINGFFQMISQLCEYWFQTVLLPTK